MQKLLIATANPGKFKSISEVFANLNIKILSLNDVDIDMSGLVEDGETFAENAIKKAQFAYDKCGIITLADDSGVFITALEGELGLKTRRWGAGKFVSDQEWADFFLKRMSIEKDKSAKFVTSIAIVGESFVETFDGELHGHISEKLLAPIEYGLPVSSCFIPNGYKDVFANLDIDVRNKISHRKIATTQARNWLEEHIGLS